MNDDAMGAERPEDRSAEAEHRLPVETPEQELERLRQEVLTRTGEAESLQDKNLRLVAEFDNARKRATRERDEYVRFANESLIRDLLPVLDNFERALQAAKTEAAGAAVTAGVELIQRELLRVLEKSGVTHFASVGQPFDPERHEAIARVPTTDHAEMTVVKETARGYLLHGRVLRPAMVAVAVGPEPSPGAAA